MKIGTFPEERPLAVFALCAGAGVLAGRFLPEAPVFLCVLGITAGLGAALTGKGNMRLAALCAAVLFAFLLRSGCYFHQPLPPHGEYLVTGVVREMCACVTWMGRNGLFPVPTGPGTARRTRR